MNTLVLQTQKVSLFYGERQALFDISLDVPKHSVVALIGPSGCGKTSYLRLFNRMNDLISNTSVTGGVYFHDQNIYAKSVDVVKLRRKIGMVFQKTNPFPKSMFDNVAYGPRAHGVFYKNKLQEIVERSLKQAALWDEVKDHLYESALTLSGGQQQRLCIARTLAVEPEVILMDEPASALDPISTQKIEELILQLKQKYTIVIVTHNLQQAARISDYTAFFYLGEMIECEKTEVMFTNPKMKRTQDYVTGRFG
ncbi:MAG: phosphate ABC transporter ATP-binding protein [Deltaproteobacteria bacterium]|nr:phosphate ABC transporter ATP-binding protein [Deltaproteobacteria bacterium]